MRIAFIYDCLFPYVFGGAERRNYALASALRHEHDVAHYSFDYWTKDSSRCLPGCRNVSLGPVVPLYDAQGRRRISEAIVFALRLWRALLHSREDVWDIVSFPYFSIPVARVLSALKRRPLIVTWHEYWGNYWYDYLGWKGFLGKMIETLALWCSPRIVTGSQHTRRRLLEAGVAPQRITINPNGVDFERILAAPASAESADLVYVGRLLAHKGVDLAVQAVHVLRHTNPQTTLWIIGDGPEKGRLEQLVQELGLGQQVRFLGALPSDEEVYARLKAARVLLLPSRREGFGIVVIEAWACGLPVVVCDEAGSALPELVDSPLKGRVVPSDPQSIASACQELLAGDRIRVSRQLQQEAARYDWKLIARQMVDVYEDARRSRSAPHSQSCRRRLAFLWSKNSTEGSAQRASS